MVRAGDRDRYGPFRGRPNGARAKHPAPAADPAAERDEERFGIDLPGYVGATDAALAVASLPGIIRAELLKDDRIAGVDARVTAAQLDAAVSLVVEIDVAPADETGDFTLTAAVDAVSLTLIGGLPA